MLEILAMTEFLTYLCIVFNDKDTNKMEEATHYTKKLRKGDYSRITEKLGNKYSRNTVEKQLKGQRTLKEDVRNAADEYIETMEKLLTPKSIES
jgi:hypothetical protein